jgi:5-(aminomethyl)-3-furanmethanol phosphate kinase
MAGGSLLSIVKLGGSYAFSKQLSDWLGALAACAGHVVVVPGGGPFADAVRHAQPQIGFDDQTAHHMALLAMDQYGCVLASLGAGLTVAPSLAAIRRVVSEGRVPIWSPTRMVLDAKDVPASWDVTADSLAAWVAGKLRAKRVLLVKQVTSLGVSIRADDLVAQGIVDPAFPRFLAASGADAFIVGPAQYAAAAAAIRNGSPAGTRIALC